MRCKKSGGCPGFFFGSKIKHGYTNYLMHTYGKSCGQSVLSEECVLPSSQRILMDRRAYLMLAVGSAGAAAKKFAV